jgi:hypothetical protein
MNNVAAAAADDDDDAPCWWCGCLIVLREREKPKTATLEYMCIFCGQLFHSWLLVN